MFLDLIIVKKKNFQLTSNICPYYLYMQLYLIQRRLETEHYFLDLSRRSVKPWIFYPFCIAIIENLFHPPNKVNGIS